ncbi:hypothetical protein [Pengzhenrongella phosphoraccumulans]|uniref:hypothetical protein n=1 Tax=Pengzhenrongella phosphoraccumulans TaxID=3114394 RepID=UPI00388EB349
MRAQAKSTWIGGTVFLGLLIAIAAWFLLISPTFATASESRTQAEATRQQNQIVALRITKLKADFAKLPEYKAELAGLQGQIPVTKDLGSYFTQLTDLAAARSVVIVAVSPSLPVSFLPAVPVVVAPVVVDPANTATSQTPAEAAAAAAAAAAPVNTGVPAGFASIAYSIDVVGSRDNVIGFLDDVQVKGPRLFLVGGLAATTLTAADAGGGRPAVADGDQEFVVSGFIYVLPDPLAVK